jgi:hypothetical protein
MSDLRHRRSAGGSLVVPALAGAVLALAAVAAPGSADAFSSGFDSRPVSLAARGGIGSFTPASVDPRIAAKVTVRALSQSRLFRFTPAGSSTRPDRSVTVAVRVDAETARAVSVRSTLAAAAGSPGAGPSAAPVRIAPTAFNLGLARGYDSFASKLTTPAEVRKIDMPDLATFDAGRGDGRQGKAAGGRFAPRITVDESAKPGRAPRTLEGQGDYAVDVGGSYRLTGSVAVTAGVRYRSERDRIAPLTDSTQDSQAVYVGTQFRF